MRVPWIIWLWCWLMVAATGNSLFPTDKTVIYTYRASARTGTERPEHATSNWLQHGKIIIKSQLNFTLIQFSDIKIQLENNEQQEEVDNELLQPFIVEYDNGRIQQLYLNVSEQQWVLNMKRALASVLQLDLEAVGRVKGAFEATENNIYGKCVTENVVRSEKEKKSIRKVINQCQETPFQKWSHTPASNCPGVSQDTVMVHTERRYQLVQNQLTQVESNGSMWLQPFHADGDTHYTQFQQELIMESMTDDGFPLTQETINEHFQQSEITYDQNTFDLTHGRHLKSKQMKITAIKEAIERLITAIESDPTNVVNIHKSVLTNMLYFDLRTLDIAELYHIYSEIGFGTSYQQETRANIFIELITQIGSTASAQFTKELILSRNINESRAVKLLAALPFYIRYETITNGEELLSILEPLITIDKQFSLHVRQTAVLSFATTVYKTYALQRCASSVFEKYTRRYMDLFLGARGDYEQQMLYLQGLNNLQLGSVTNFLLPVISQGSEYSDHLRFLAIWATTPSMLTTHQVYEIYWPILEDHSESVEMRIAAFLMLLTVEPSTGRLLTLHWFLQRDPNPHLYHFYYTTLLSLQHTTYPCYAQLSNLASKMVRLLRIPKRYWMSGNYLFDYTDLEQRGAMLQLYLFGNGNTDRVHVVQLTMDNYMQGRSVNQFSLHLKLQGVTESLTRKLKQTPNSFDQVLDVLRTAHVTWKYPQPLHIEIIARIEGKTIFSRFINQSNFDMFYDIVMNLVNTFETQYHVNYQHIGVTLTGSEFYPSDLGTPLFVTSLSGAFTSMRGNYSNTVETGGSVWVRRNNLDMRYIYQTQYALFAYNPLADVFQGVERQTIVYGTFPLRMNIYLNVSQWQLTLQQDPGPLPNLLFHTRSVTFIRSPDATAMNSNLSSEYSLHTHNEMENRTVMEFASTELMQKVKMSALNCDSGDSLWRIWTEINRSHRSNSNVLPMMQYVLKLIHIWDYISLLPVLGRCGAVFAVEPIDANQHPSLSWSFNVIDQQEINRLMIKTALDHQYGNSTSSINVLNMILSIEQRAAPVQSFHIGITVDRNLTNSHQRFCSNWNMLLTKWTPDMFSIKPVDPIYITGNASWGQTSQTNEQHYDHEKWLYINITGEITDEQKEEMQIRKKWPFNECDEMKGSLKFSPLTEECYRASLIASTPMKYTLSLQHFNKE